MRLILPALLLMAFAPGSAFAQSPLTPEQQEKLKERDALNRKVNAQNALGNFKASAALVEKILDLERAVLGEKHADVLGSLYRLAKLHELDGDFAGAEKTWERLIALRTEISGGDHWQTVDARLGLKNAKLRAGLTKEQHAQLRKALEWNAELIALYGQRKFAEAITLADDIIKVRKEVMGEKHPEYADSLTNAAALNRALGKSAEAERLFRDVLRIRKEIMGVKHPAYAIALNNLGEFLHSLGKFQEAESLYREALRIRKEVLGERHPDYALSLNNLGSLYNARGNFAEVESLYREALRIRKEVLGEKHPSYAQSLNNLAGLYNSQGKYAETEALLREALRILKEAFGEKHPDYAASLNNLASVCESQGKYAEAEPLYREAVQIRKEVLGEKHPDYATGLNNLAGLYKSREKYAEAETLYRDALRILKEAVGEKHPHYAASLNNLALLYTSQEKYAEAEPLYRDALKIRKEALGEKHPDYGVSLSNLAGLFQAQKKYAEAEPLYLDALRIRKDSLGEKSTGFATSLNNLASLYFAQGQYAKAEPLNREAARILQDRLGESAAVQSEADQLRHVAISRIYLDNYLAIPEADAEAMYAAVFRWHGAVTARQTFTRLAGRATPETRGVLGELQDLTRHLNRLTQNPLLTMPKDELAKQVKELDDKRETLEKKIAAQSKDFAEYKTHLKLTPTDLQKALPDDTALIEFLVHGDTASAFVVTNKSLTRVRFHGDGFGEELATFRGATSLMRTRPVNDEDDAAVKLRARIWEPLEPHLKGIKRVLICPDGLLCRLPFAALPGADPKKYLLEELSIVIVPVPQLLPALLATDAKKFSGAPSLLAVGDVDFDGDPAAGEKVKPLPVGLTRSGNGLSWKPLPNTKGEVEVVGTLFAKLPQSTVQKLLGGDATEAALERELGRHRFVHLATHGFFTDPKMVRQFKDDQSASGEQVLLPAIPPGLSSGIVCAGANKPTFQTSGVITATQIAELDLRNVELAVLSACETSLGTLSGGEGVLGLQRAFQMAGARSTITTMWAVYDQSTAELMKRMYSNRLENGLAAAEALREAQLWVLNNGDKVGAFPEAPRAGKRTPPKYWAAFGFSGDWR